MAEVSSFKKSEDSISGEDDETKSIKDELATILRLQHDDIKDQVVDHLLSHGRQGLKNYKDDIVPKIYAVEMNGADGKLITTLKKYFQRQWETQHGSSNGWFVTFLRKYQNGENPQLYERVLTRTAEYGNKYMKDCPVLSIVLQFIFELIDDEAMESTNVFDDLWSAITETGMEAVTKYSNYIREEVMKNELDKHQSALYQALREYYCPRLQSLSRQHDLPEEQALYDLALDRSAENGLLMGTQAVQKPVGAVPWNTPIDEDETLINSHSTAAVASVDEDGISKDIDVQKSTTDSTIKVDVRHTGETHNVPRALIPMLLEHCEFHRTHSGEFDATDYYLVLSKNEEALDEDTTLEEISISEGNILEFELCKKASIPEQIIAAALLSSTGNHTEEMASPDEPISSDATKQSVCTKRSVSLQLNKSNSKHESPALSLPVQNPSSGHSESISSIKKRTDLLHKEDLAINYHQLQNKIREISEKMTLDPVLRRTIAEKFSEINIVICGAPRVGKSTLINAICRQKLAKTSPGLHACTNVISPFFLKDSMNIGDETISYQYNFWDTPGFESWDRESIRTNLERIKQKPKSDILCMIYCASPGSFANLRQLEWLLEECTRQHIFCALVCTNKWGGLKQQRDAVMKDLEETLEKYHPKTREENGVIYFGTVGLCTSVNALAVKDEETGREYQVSGINELIFGIMQSLDNDKVAQWCMVAFENKPYWKQLFTYGASLKSLWNKFTWKA